MRGSDKVILILNKLLTGELSAADQYFVHSRMLENWGYNVLHQRLEHERMEELEHAGRLINRILFLEGVPDVQSREALNIGSTVEKILANDLAYELVVVANLKEAIALCEAERDYDTRRILVDLLQETEEDHVHWLEKQNGLLAKLGLNNYLQSAAGELSGGAS